MIDTTKYNFDAGLERAGTGSIKWDKYDFLYPDAPKGALPFWVADSDLPAAKPIVEALTARAAHPAYGYTWHLTERYFDSVTSWFRDRFEWEVNREEIVFTPGLVHSIAMAVRTFTQEGDKVIIQTPVYHPFYDMVSKNNRIIEKNPLVYVDGKYEIDFDNFEQTAKDPKTKLFILCSPHNPIGRVWTKDELRRMSQICFENDVLIFSDEIHFDLTRNGIQHFPLSAVAPEHKENIIVGTAPSKTFNIPGLQMSNNVIHSEKLREAFKNEFSASGNFGANVFAGVATLAAYESGANWLDQLKDYLDSNVQFIQSELESKLPKAKLIYPEATYLAWIDFSDYGLRPHKLTEKFVQEAKVVLSDGLTFGVDGGGFMRLNFACKKDLLRECFDRIAGVLK